MKEKRNNLFIALLCIPFLLHANPEISLEVFRYRSADGPYIEVSLYVAGASLGLPEGSSEYGIRYILMVKNKADQVVAGGNYRLVANGTSTRDIMDVKRFALPTGHYTVSLEATDIADEKSLVAVDQDIEMDSAFLSGHLSDLQLASVIKIEQAETPALNKSGMYIEPIPFRLYYPALSQLLLYHEIYAADQLEGQPYLQYTIKPAAGDIPAPIVTYKKLKKEPVQPNILQLDITKLISGPYVLEAKLFDGNKAERAVSQVFFSRLNPVGDSIYVESAPVLLENAFTKDIPADSLDYCMRALAPIVDSYDVDVMNALLEKGSDNAKRFFLHRYYTTQAGKHAVIAFQTYMRVARAVDETYRSGFGYGFETDRGHIFLKYGMPNDVIEVEDEPSAPPYEIWFYNEFPATNQVNVRFLFYNPSLAHNAFKLLHSTAIGEVRNDRWEIELYRDATLETPPVGETVMGDNVHRNARQYFER